MTPRQQSILIGAVVTGILSTSYLGFINTLCCIGVIVGGIVATQQYVSRTGSVIQAGDGAVIGGAAGAAGALLAAIFDLFLRPFNLDSQSIQQNLQEQIAEMGGTEGMSPEMMQQFQGEGPEVFSLLWLGLLAMNVIVYAIFGAIGGAIGTALFGEEADGTDGGVQTAEAEVVDE